MRLAPHSLYYVQVVEGDVLRCYQTMLLSKRLLIAQSDGPLVIVSLASVVVPTCTVSYRALPGYA